MIKYIAFEGIEKCGKSTQIKMLKQHLVQRYYKVIEVREPGGTEFGEDLRELLMHKFYPKSFKAQAYAFDAARANLIDQIYIPNKDQDIFLLSDRCLFSTQAYQGYGPQPDAEKAEKIVEYLRKQSEDAVQGILPDLTFLIDITIEEMQRRFEHGDKIENKKDFFESKDPEYFKRVREGYFRIMDYYNNKNNENNNNNNNNKNKNNNEHKKSEIVRIDGNDIVSIIAVRIRSVLYKKFAISE